MSKLNEPPLGAAVREVRRPPSGDEVVAAIRAFNAGAYPDGLTDAKPCYPWYVRLWRRIRG